MRIRELGVQSVLHFHDFRLDFGNSPGGLHVIYGPNEAGKSTLLRLLVNLLFGGKIDDAALDIYDSHSRIHGVLHHPQGADLPRESGDTGEAHFPIRRRRKWNSLYLIDESEADLAEEVLLPFLGGFDRDRYTLLFGFDHERLRAGGDSLLSSGGNAGISLFEAGGGVQFLQSTLQALSARVDGLVDPSFRRTSAKLLNAAWNRYKDFSDQSRKAGLRGEEWQRQREELVRLEQEIRGMRDKSTGLVKEQSRLERIKRVRQTVLELDAARSQLQSLSGLPELSPELDAKIPASIKQAQDLAERMEEHRRDALHRSHALESLAVDTAALAVKDEVTRMMENVGQYEEYAAQLPELRTKLNGQRSQAESRLQEIAPGQDLDDADGLRIPYAKELSLRGLASEWKELLRDQRELEKGSAELSAQRQRLERDQREIGQVPDITKLRDVWNEFQDVGDVEGELEKRKAQRTEYQDSARHRLDSQGIWHGQLEGLSTLRVPLAETVSIYADEYDRLERELEQSKREQSTAEQQLADCQMDLRGLELGALVPVESDLVQARARRETGWMLVKQSWLQGSVDAVEVSEYTSGSNGNGDTSGRALEGDASSRTLVEAFEEAVEEADRISDWMRRDSEKSAHRAHLLLQEERLTQVLDRAKGRLADLANKQGALQGRWSEEWAASGIQPKTPNEMKEWLSQTFRPLVEELRAIASFDREIEAMGQSVQKWTATLRDALSVIEGLDVDPASLEQAGLRKLRTIAQQALAVANERSLLQSGLTKRWEDYADQEQKQQTTAEGLQSAILRVEQAWAENFQEYTHLPSDLTLVPDYLDKLKGLFEDIRELKRVTLDEATKRAACEAFEEAMGRLARRFEGVIPQGVSSSDYVRSLNQRVATALQDERSRLGSEAELARVQAAMSDVAHALQVATGEVEGYLARYGCENVEELRALVRNSELRKDAAKKIADLEEQLRRSGDGLTVTELEGEVSQAPDVDELESQLQALDGELAEYKQQIDELQQALWGAKQAFNALDGQNSSAAELAQQAENQLGDVDRLWNETLRLELARRLMQRAIEDFRRQNESKVLHRAEELFQRLTLGRYPELTVEYDGSIPVLQAVSRDGAKRRVHQMSDGTRDQLYLALRLAFVEQHTSSGHAMPLVLDDILVHYDDERTFATLEILAELAEHVQVLYFTHHRSIVDAVPEIERTCPAQVGVHEIGQRTPLGV